MKSPITRIALLLLSGLCAAACCLPQRSAETSETPVAGFITDLAAFEQFIATAPQPAQFLARYPDVTLVLPGSIATKELRTNRSRYFAVLDGAGRITGGRFQ